MSPKLTTSSPGPVWIAAQLPSGRRASRPPYGFGHGENGHGAEIGMGAGPQLARQRCFGEDRIVVAAQDREVAVDLVGEIGLGQIQGGGEDPQQVDGEPFEGPVEGDQG